MKHFELLFLVIAVIIQFVWHGFGEVALVNSVALFLGITATALIYTYAPEQVPTDTVPFYASVIAVAGLTAFWSNLMISDQLTLDFITTLMLAWGLSFISARNVK